MTADRGPVPPQLPLDELVIDPKAEAISPGRGKTSGQDESNFFAEDGQRYKLLQNQLKLGHLGKLWGSSSSAPTNIAGLLLLLCFLVVCASFFVTPTPGIEDLRKWLYGITTTCLGYLLGSRTAGKNE